MASHGTREPGSGLDPCLGLDTLETMPTASLRRLGSVALAMGLTLLSGCANHGSWSRYEVGEVEFYSQVSERKTQELLTKFSKFRQVTAALTSASTVEPTMPTRVYLFADQSSYEDHVNIE